MGFVVSNIYKARKNLENKYDKFNICVLNIINYVVVFCGYLHSFWCKDVTGWQSTCPTKIEIWK